ncbi:unnamed protein product [Cylicostephanus goldi]|uniref:Rege-1 UBA-like domain-containing protein n=1 Tax=Cylicostephanus goldi TaxID=71465 RepID=A0A3P6SUM2_CYLGO|nr:unnamed protein product [Cylicostephanus goldi]
MERKHPPLRRVSRGVPAKVSFGAQLSEPLTDSGTRRAELNEEDSCYSSCSEESHPSLSRESSETVGSDLGLGRLKLEEDTAKSSAPFTAPPHLVEFARNLGYSQERLIAVLKKIGCDAGQDRILAELVQMGRGSTEQPESVIFTPAPSSTLRPIVIDGSNIAMTSVRFFS